MRPMAKHSIDSKHGMFGLFAVGAGIAIKGILDFLPANKEASAVREAADRAARDDARAEKARRKAKAAAAKAKAKAKKAAKAAAKAAKAPAKPAKP